MAGKRMTVCPRHVSIARRTVTSLLLFSVALTAYAVKPITLVPVGRQMVGSLSIDVTPGWNTLNADPKGGPTLAVWTCDGSLLDRLMIYSGVGDDRPLSTDRTHVPLPHFRASMPQSDLVTFVEKNLATMFGDDPATVTSRDVRPQAFGDNAGILFEVEITPVELAHYKGIIGAFVADRKLYLMMYIGADPYYYDAHLAAARDMIVSARL
jgi:hypothetical protein